MEVFSKYFRRLLVGNAPQIFPGINRNVENPANYQLLVQEMDKICQDPDQASKIAETIDTSEGDLFRDFDLSLFVEHFKLDPLATILLTSAFMNGQRSDLKTKGMCSLKYYPLRIQPPDVEQPVRYFPLSFQHSCRASRMYEIRAMMLLRHYLRQSSLNI